jgi:hypothetical protein
MMDLQTLMLLDDGSAQVPVRPVSGARLATSAPWLRLADDWRAWPWRYCSALELLSRAPMDQDLFLAWAQGLGFTGVRVLTTHAHAPGLPPSIGLARLPTLLGALKSRGMGVELVALADTGTQGLSRGAMRAHVVALGAIAAAADLPTTIELFNENGHPTQQLDAADTGFLRELRALIPSRVPVSLGCWGADFFESYPGGDYITQHRERGRDTFQEVARVKHLIELSHDSGKFVVDDEPIGAGEVDEAGKRSANPARFFAQGVLDRLGNVGGTFHFNDGVPARVPGPVQQQCAEAFIHGSTLVPDDAVFSFRNDSSGGGITQGADWSRVFKLFGLVRNGGVPSYVVALGVTGDYSARYVNGWRPSGVVAERPGVQVIEVVR